MEVLSDFLLKSRGSTCQLPRHVSPLPVRGSAVLDLCGTALNQHCSIGLSPPLIRVCSTASSYAQFSLPGSPTSGMEHFDYPRNALAFASWLLLLILDSHHALLLASTATSEGECDDKTSMLLDAVDDPLIDTSTVMANTLTQYRLCCLPTIFSEDVLYWVKPRSTTWFSRFLLKQYNNSRWISMFRMTKASVFNLADLLAPHVEKKNTKYRLAIPVLVRVACTLFKLTHGANLTICSEMFAVGRSTVCKFLRDVVYAINDTLRHEISWPHGRTLREVQAKFSNFCSLPAVAGAIDGMHVAIAKPPSHAADYSYFKSGGYSVNCQAVVDSDKRFLDLYVGMPGSTNDARMLRRSTLHQLASHGNLFEAADSVDGHSPFLIGDLGYPLLPWLMVPHRGGHALSLSESLFNRKLRRGRSVVENAFGILKHTFQELLHKTDLQLTFLPDVIVCCALLHNLLLRQSHDEVEELLRVLRSEGFQTLADDEAERAADEDAVVQEDSANEVGIDRRAQLGIYLSTRRRSV